MSDSTGRNRLGAEESPYLQQHADNPVNWQPWDEEALEAARERDVPIFLSIGYSACHWCHVMAEESFQDETVAEVLNEEFVPIKVDREERPDLDKIYQTICQLVSGRGGWPLSVWLTPEGEPFYVGTYFPPEPRRGAPGFLDLLGDIADSWAEDREEVERRAEQWTGALTDELEDTPEAGGETSHSELLEEAASTALRSADREHGGFGSSGPKFPQPGRLELLMQADAASRATEAADVVVETLDAMAAGGIYDQIGGGFHRYATDRSWTVPHFEKMLYDNAELPRVYLDAVRAYDDATYARIAQETLSFVERELRHPDGGFYSTLDAQSPLPPSRRERGESARDGAGGGSVEGGEAAEGDEAAEEDEAAESDEVAMGDEAAEGGDATESEEGAFYVRTPEEVRDALDDETTADLVCDRFGITPGGNFERGTTVLTVAESIADLTAEYDLDRETIVERLAAARVDLFEARESRPRPARDEKILAGWNGLMIAAFAAGARTLDSQLADTAADALRFVREQLWDASSQQLSRRFKDGDVKGRGYLEDYAFLARGAFDLYQATGDVDALSFALELARTIEAEFWDEEARTLYFTPESGEQLVTRPQELTDQSTPSSLGVAVDLLLDLQHFDPDAAFGDIAEQVLATHADRARGSPLEHVSLVRAAAKRDRGAVELTIAADEIPAGWRESLAETYFPSAITAPRPPTADGLQRWLDALDLDEAPPIWRGRDAEDGEPTIYACESFTCSPPKQDVQAALEWLEGNA